MLWSWSITEKFSSWHWLLFQCHHLYIQVFFIQSEQDKGNNFGLRPDYEKQICHDLYIWPSTNLRSLQTLRPKVFDITLTLNIHNQCQCTLFDQWHAVNENWAKLDQGDRGSAPKRIFHLILIWLSHLTLKQLC